jgi:hypothetical protein
MSLGYPCYYYGAWQAQNCFNTYCDDYDATLQSYSNYINAAIRKNISVLISAGNYGTELFADYGEVKYVSAPSCIQNVTTIGATVNAGNATATYSNLGSVIDLLAPGGDQPEACSVAEWGGAVSCCRDTGRDSWSTRDDT